MVLSGKLVKTIAVVSAVCFLFFLAKAFYHPKQKKAMQPRPVKTAVSFTKDAPVYVESFGNLVPLANVNIIAQVDGEMTEVFFKDGDTVKKGDKLFTIDPAPYKASLDKAKAQMSKDEMTLQLKKDTLERNKKLEKSNLISAQDLEQYGTDVDTAQAEVDLQKAAVDSATITYNYCFINSPIDGIAGKRLVDLGNIVYASSKTTLVNIKTIDTLNIDFTVPERELIRLRGAMTANSLSVGIVPQGYTGEPYEGTLVFIDNSVDNSTGTVALRAVIDNKKHALWAGEFVTVRLVLSTKKDAVMVPYEALSLGQKGTYVFVVKADNTVEMRPVTQGQKQGDNIDIEKGLSSGEKVVTQGQMGLWPGAPIVDIDMIDKKKKEGETKK
jgi:multidrug efflux system membrane fusion protein